MYRPEPDPDLPPRPTLEELKKAGLPVYDPWAAHSKRSDPMSQRGRSIDLPLPKLCEQIREP